MELGGQELEFPSNELRPVAPAKNDRVRVIQGEYRGAAGELLSIEDNTNEGVVQLYEFGVNIFNLSMLAKFQSTQSY